MNFFTELNNRITLESPKFFKTFQAIGAWLFGAGLMLVGIPAAFISIVPDADIDFSLLLKISSYMVLAGMIIRAMASLPVVNPDYPTLDKKDPG